MAGLIDKYGSHDGKYNTFILPISVLNNSDIDYIVRSLGFRIDIKGTEIIISGVNLHEIPVKIKQRANRDNVKSQSEYDCCIVKTEKLDNNCRMFYGFELDGNQRYMMANCFVTYNSNGKSTTVDFMQYIMGDYFGVLPTTVLTMKRKSSSGASPELANKRGKRFLVIQEPEHDDVVYVGQMKNLTGSDWIEARALYGDPFIYKPQFKLVLICNKLPEIPATDGGTWRRLRVTPWETEFVDDPKKEKAHQFKKDPELLEKLKQWQPAGAWILLRQYYQDYRKNGIKEPAKVTRFTDEYKKNSDVYYEFIKEYYTITGEMKDKESMVGLYECFKGWYKGTYNSSIPAKKDVQGYLMNMEKVKVLNGMVMGLKCLIGGEEDEATKVSDSV